MGAGDNHYQTSKDLIELMKNGEKRVVVSYLLIMETIHVIRKRSVKRSKISDTASVLDAARALSNEFKDYVMSGVGKGEIVLVESDGISGHGYRIFQKASSVQGTVRNRRGYTRSPKSRRSAHRKPQPARLRIGCREYRALGHADIEHAYLADYGGAREFHTMDLSFRDLDGDPDFAVKFVVHGGKGP